MTDHELTRRDALVALGAVGGAAGAGALAWDRFEDDPDREGFDPTERETLVALAETIYPEAVSGVAEFVERYVVGRVADRPDYAAGMREAIGALDDYAETWAGGPFRERDPDSRDELLRGLGVDVADADPDGAEQERVRYYLVNDLQYALYTTPTGGELVGIENPQGHPGGATSYRQPPE
ncbi:gluconate 2-dehydrogenase subunit 3 family protein [Halomicrobium salinisoli]|uniref:gluconate 2-dehydrogenase subunit 3 family protein n=1 Tax=Halomicrobium salinisoli TaxID=2878391 RepID=UPI001CEFC021|nr:gluconate 2-dehydrogenase subunit 3 family protein [Halomicrobium salinisoli]